MFNSERLKKLRKDLGLTQEEISLELDIQQSSYSKYETNTADLNLELLQKIRDKFNIDPIEFINTTNSNVNFENGSVVNGSVIHGNNIVNADNHYTIPKKEFESVLTTLKNLTETIIQLVAKQK